MIAARASTTEPTTGAALKTTVLWGGLLLVLVSAGLLGKDESTRRHGLQAVLLLMAAGEAVGAFVGVFWARRMAEPTGRPYDPAYHGVRQDFGFYNLAMALLFALCAVNPERNVAVLAAAVVLYAVHGGTHLLRYFGLYYGGEVPVPTRPRHFELRDALPLLVALAGILIFYPSPSH
jgi:hypothetical protein